MAREPVEALENAVAHHKDEMPPALVARHATLTTMRRGALAVGGLGVITAGLLVGERLSPGINGFVAIAGTLAVWLGGFRLLTLAMTAARRAIARSTLASFERAQHLGALGGSGAPVGVSALLTPAQQVLLAAEEKAEAKRVRAAERAAMKSATTDRDAPDFDDT